MQPGPSPEDINTILNRFQSWAEKHPSEGSGNGNGHRGGSGSEEIREIPYDEAIQQYRSRHGGQTTRRAAERKTRISAGTSSESLGEKPPVKTESKAPAAEMEEEPLPQWVSELPEVAPSETVIELKAAAPPPRVAVETVGRARMQSATDLEEATEMVRRAIDRAQKKRNSAPGKAKPAVQRPAAMAAKSEIPAPGVVATPTAATIVAAAPVAKPERKAPRKPAPARSAAAHPSRAKLEPAASVAVTRKAAIATPPMKTRVKTVRIDPKSSLIKAQIKTARQSPAPRIGKTVAQSAGPGATQRSSAPTPPPRVRKPKQHPPFHKVLANTVHRAKISAVARKKKPAPDRTRRITTRFSLAEQRRIEKLAADADLTVSAYLRECALAVVASQTPLVSLPAFATRNRKAKAAAPVEYQQNAYSAPAPSLVGGWLSLIRNRFLGPSVRFSEQN
jgi:hypothetical protein